MMRLLQLLLLLCAFCLGLSIIWTALETNEHLGVVRIIVCMAGFAIMLLTFAIVALTAWQVILEDLKYKLLEARIAQLEKEKTR